MAKVLVGAVTFGLIASSCGFAESEVVLQPDANREIVLDMGEFTFGADVIEVTAGETVTFVLVNEGSNEHEFMIGRNVQETSLGYPNGFEHDFFEDGIPMVEPPSAGMDMAAMAAGEMDGMDMSDDGVMSDDEMDAMDGMESSGDAALEGEEDGVHAGFMVQRRPGEVARLTMTVPEDAVGEWDIGCFRGLGSHWDAGMRATLIVKAA